MIECLKLLNPFFNDTSLTDNGIVDASGKIFNTLLYTKKHVIDLQIKIYKRRTHLNAQKNYFWSLKVLLRFKLNKNSLSALARYGITKQYSAHLECH